jgi:THO complex subunit 2
MQIRNAFIILMRIQPHFPVISKLAQIIERKVEKVKEEEKNQRQDLFVLASSYIAILKSKAKELMKESDFHQVADRVQKEKEPQEVKVINGDSKPGEFLTKPCTKYGKNNGKSSLKFQTSNERPKSENAPKRRS